PPQPLLGLGTGRGQKPELARDRSAVHVGVVVLDLLVGDGENVAALHLDPGAVGFKSLERPGPGERAPSTPAYGRALARRRRLQHLEREIRKGGEQGREVTPNPFGTDHLLVAH